MTTTTSTCLYWRRGSTTYTHSFAYYSGCSGSGGGDGGGRSGSGGSDGVSFILTIIILLQDCMYVCCIGALIINTLYSLQRSGRNISKAI